MKLKYYRLLFESRACSMYSEPHSCFPSLKPKVYFSIPSFIYVQPCIGNHPSTFGHLFHKITITKSETNLEISFFFLFFFFQYKSRDNYSVLSLFSFSFIWVIHLLKNDLWRDRRKRGILIKTCKELVIPDTKIRSHETQIRLSKLYYR